MSEHDDLKAVVRHVGGEITVALDHAFAEIAASTPDGEGTLAVGVPMREKVEQFLFVPRQKELGQFVVVDSVGVWGISNPNVGLGVSILTRSQMDVAIRTVARRTLLPYARWRQFPQNSESATRSFRRQTLYETC